MQIMQDCTSLHGHLNLLLALARNDFLLLHILGPAQHLAPPWYGLPYSLTQVERDGLHLHLFIYLFICFTACIQQDMYVQLHPVSTGVC